MEAGSPFQDAGSLIFMAVALGMDGFSVSLSIGLQKIRLRQMILIGTVLGFFHFLLPFTGMIIGQFLSVRMGELTSFIGSLLLVLIGSYMFFSALKESDKFSFNAQNPLHILSVAVAVSLDSFPVGLSIGLQGVESFVIILFIGFTAMIFALVGLVIGRRTRRLLGVYSEMLGGLILFLFGLRGLF